MMQRWRPRRRRRLLDGWAQVGPATGPDGGISGHIGRAAVPFFGRATRRTDPRRLAGGGRGGRTLPLPKPTRHSGGAWVKLWGAVSRGPAFPISRPGRRGPPSTAARGGGGGGGGVTATLSATRRRRSRVASLRPLSAPLTSQTLRRGAVRRHAGEPRTAPADNRHPRDPATQRSTVAERCRAAGGCSRSSGRSDGRRVATTRPVRLRAPTLRSCGRHAAAAVFRVVHGPEAPCRHPPTIQEPPPPRRRSRSIHAAPDDSCDRGHPLSIQRRRGAKSARPWPSAVG